MKKATLILMILSVSILSAQLRIGADVNGNTKVSVIGISADAATGTGITLGYDHMLSDMFGAGGEFQVNREMEDAGKFGFTSIYGVGKFGSGAMNGIIRLGYALIFSGDDDFASDADTKGGIMYGVGGNYKINDNLGFELGYYSNAGTAEFKAEGSTITADFTYTRINAGLTYSF